MNDYGSDIYTEPDGDPDTLANLGPLRPAGRHLGERRSAPTTIPSGPGPTSTVPVDRRRDLAQRLRRALRAAADRPADQRSAAVLRAALPRAHREARRGRDVPRPGRILAVGTGARTVTHTLAIPARSGRCWPPAPPSPTPPSSRSRADARLRDLRHPVEPVPRPAFRTLSFRMRVTVQRRRHVVVRGRHGAAAPRPRRAVPPHRPQHAHARRGTDTEPTAPLDPSADPPIRGSRAAWQSAAFATREETCCEPLDARPRAVNDAAWSQIDAEADRSLKHFLAARRLVDFSGPLGWEHSALDIGRVAALDAARSAMSRPRNDGCCRSSSSARSSRCNASELDAGRARRDRPRAPIR